MLTVVLGVLSAILPLLFAFLFPARKTVVSSVAGVPGLDYAGNMRAISLPALAVMGLALFLTPGCSVTDRDQAETVFVETGGVVRIATNKSIPIATVDAAGVGHTQSRSINGFAAMPMSVYTAMKARLGGTDNAKPVTTPNAKTKTIVFVEAGGLARIATNNPIPVGSTGPTGKEVITSQSIGGYAVMPLSVYNAARAKLGPQFDATPEPPATVPSVTLPPASILQKPSANAGGSQAGILR